MHIPVIGFQNIDHTKLTGVKWNTFRRGDAWAKRDLIETPVRVYNQSEPKMPLYQRPIYQCANVVVAELEFLLHKGIHALSNHLCIENGIKKGEEARDYLCGTLKRMYGSNYADGSATFSIIWFRSLNSNECMKIYGEYP